MHVSVSGDIHWRPCIGDQRALKFWLFVFLRILEYRILISLFCLPLVYLSFPLCPIISGFRRLSSCSPCPIRGFRRLSSLHLLMGRVMSYIFTDARKKIQSFYDVVWLHTSFWVKYVRLIAMFWEIHYNNLCTQFAFLEVGRNGKKHSETIRFHYGIWRKKTARISVHASSTGGVHWKQSINQRRLSSYKCTLI